MLELAADPTGRAARVGRLQSPTASHNRSFSPGRELSFLALRNVGGGDGRPVDRKCRRRNVDGFVGAPAGVRCSFVLAICVNLDGTAGQGNDRGGALLRVVKNRTARLLLGYYGIRKGCPTCS